jgi:2-phosphoglycolate phosphatase
MFEKCVIFDLDGTLIDSSAGVVAATNYALEQLGEKLRSHDEITAYIGFPLREMFTAFTTAPFEELRQHFQDHGKDAIVAATRPLPHADRVLRELCAAGYRLAIATTKIQVHIGPILDKCGWAELFETTVGGDEVASVKPAPDAFQLALDRLQSDRHRSIVVGDTVNDVLAARCAQLPVVAVTSPYGGIDRLQAAGATYFLASLQELPELLRAHFEGDNA